MLKLLQYCNYIIIVMQIKLMLLLLTTLPKRFVSVVVVVLKFGSDQGFCFKRTLVAVLRTFV